MLFTILLTAFSISIGIGTDIILVQIVKYFFGFNALHSYAIAQICTVVSTFTRLLFTYKNRNPYRDAPEIDYNLAVVFLPSLFMGSSIGVLIRYLIPDLWMSLIFN